jgi:predicted negative regulator of RcsB-dependent stress response
VSACTNTQTTRPPIVEDRTTDVAVQTAPPVTHPRSSEPSIVVEKHLEKSESVTTTPIATPVIPQRSTPKAQNPAVVALIDSAQAQQSKGDLNGAQSSLQRAQRISPRDPEVYYELAKIHRDLGDLGLAEQVALKGVSIVEGQALQSKRFWSLIAEIRGLAGNTRGSEQARSLANKY